MAGATLGEVRDIGLFVDPVEDVIAGRHRDDEAGRQAIVLPTLKAERGGVLK